MQKVIVRLISFSLFVLIVSSCVPLRKYQDMESKKEQCMDENTKLKKENERLNALKNEQTASIEKLTKDFNSLVNDTTRLGKTLRNMENNYSKLNETYQLLLDKNKELLAGNREETQKILSELQKAQADLLRREDSLKKLEKEYHAKKKSLDELSQELAISQAAIKDREKQLQELQAMINKKDSVVNALKTKVTDALLGFKDQGLSIEQRNQKIYVKMENKLLFASGSFQISSNGKDALVKLGKVLEQNTDVEIVIEGHTDDVPYKGSGNLEDNWDLSVKRATTIVRILINNTSIDPARLMAAGRSKFHPIDEADTDEARAKNRRTEIILTPNLDELFQLINKTE